MVDFNHRDFEMVLIFILSEFYGGLMAIHVPGESLISGRGFETELTEFT
jgi:hypothetical protein